MNCNRSQDIITKLTHIIMSSYVKKLKLRIGSKEDKINKKVKSSCAVCKKKFKNVLRHVQQKSSCKDNMTDEDYLQLKQRADDATRARSRKAMAKRRERLRLQDHDALKRAQNEWKESEWRGNENLRRECNNYDKEKSRERAREKDLAKVREDQRRWKRSSRMKAKEREKGEQKEKEDEEDKTKNLDAVIPERCPVCNTKKKHILRHIKTSELCFQKVDRSTFDKWKELSRKRTKSQYQYQYVDNGNHSKAQDKYLGIKKNIKEELNKKKGIKNDKERDMRLKSFYFRRMSVWFLRYLTHGRIPPEWSTKCFGSLGGGLVVQEEVFYKDEKLLSKAQANAWLMEIDTAVLEAVISMQILVLIPKLRWVKAIEIVELNEEEELKIKLLQLIGKLQAGGNANTKDISIPSKYESKMTEITWDAKVAFDTDKLTTEEEMMLTDLVAEVLGEQEGLLHRKFQELLDITKDIDNLFDAFFYTANKFV